MAGHEPDQAHGTLITVRDSSSSPRTVLWITIASCLLVPIWPVPYVPAASLLWLFLLPITAPRLRSQPLKLLFSAFVLTLISVLAVGTLTHSPTDDLIKIGLALTVLLLTLVTFTDLLCRSPHNNWGLIVALLGISVTLAVAIFLKTQPGYGIWKYGLAWPTTLAVVGLADYFLARGAKKFAALLLLGMAGVLLATSSRSMAAIVLSALLISFARSGAIHQDGMTASGPASTRAAKNRIISLGGLGAAVAIASYAMQTGLFGSTLQAKWRDQGGTPWGVLMSGRPELQFSINVLERNPLGGYGVGNPVPPAGLEDVARALASLSDGDQIHLLERIAYSGVNVHSFLLDTWLQGSVVAVFGPLCAIVLVIIALFGGRFHPTPLLAFSCLAIFWDFAFSPMTYFSTVLWGITLAVVVAELGRQRLHG